MANQLYIRCPDCGTKIPFDPYAMVRGERFACPKCPSLSIGIDRGSRETVKETLDQLQDLKQNMGERRPGAPLRKSLDERT